MPEPVDASPIRSANGHLVSVVANGVNSRGAIVEWVVECYTEGCSFHAGPSSDLARLERIRDEHLHDPRG